MASTTYTITAVNAKAGSIVLTPSVITSDNLPKYFLNLKSVKLVGNNAFLPGGTTLNPQASIALFCGDTNSWLIKDLLMSSITAIGGAGTPATLALTLAAIAALIAE